MNDAAAELQPFLVVNREETDHQNMNASFYEDASCCTSVTDKCVSTKKVYHFCELITNNFLGRSEIREASTLLLVIKVNTE